jgi:hypothetical protein
MRWNFGHALEIVKNIRQIKVDAVVRARKRYQDQLNAQLLEKKRQEELAAKEKKLAKTKLAVKPVPLQMVVKTGVAGLVLPKPKPLELKAQQLKLSDMPPMNTNLSDQEIDDLSIRAGDVSRLFR